jgi:hypothetical protein
VDEWTITVMASGYFLKRLGFTGSMPMLLFLVTLRAVEVLVHELIENFLERVHAGNITQ